MEYKTVSNNQLKVFLIDLLQVVKKAKDLKEVIKHLENLISHL